MIVQRSLFQPDLYPMKFVHPSMWGGGVGRTCPPRWGYGGLIHPSWGGPGASSPPTGVSGAAPLMLKTDVKLPCKSIVISSQSGPFIR